MSGLTDYAATKAMAFLAGQTPQVALPSVWLALFTTAPTSDAGTGGTEVTGGSYTRIQVGGPVAATASFTTASPNITMTTNPGWVVPGMNVYDLTKTPAPGAQVGTVLTYVTTSLVLTANSLINSQGTTDSLTFTSFAPPVASSGNPEPNTLPATMVNTNATITFPTATASWGTVTSWGLYDASSSGNLMWWDYLGNFKWIPFSCSNASPGILTVDSVSDVPVNGSSVVVTQKYGGTLPTTGGSFSGLLTTAGSSTNTFNVGVNTTSVGGGLFRQVTQQPIAINVTSSFSTSQFTLSMA